MTSNFNSQKGFVLIFALVVLTTLLMAVLAVISLMIPRLAVIREAASSMGALYSADSAAEWCIYGQRKNRTFGSTVGSISQLTDTGDAGAQDGSRFTSLPGPVGQTIGIGIFTGDNIAVPPCPAGGLFQMALYADRDGTGTRPGALLGSTVSGNFVPNSWNMLPLTGITINPDTIYWIGYNASGTRPDCNNYRFRRGQGTLTGWTTPTAFTTWLNPFIPPPSPPNDWTRSDPDLTPSNFVVYSGEPAGILTMANGAANAIYIGTQQTPYCASAQNLNYRVLGTHKGIVRSFEIFSGEPEVFQCNDGIDNDGDLVTDFPADPGCASATDNSESSVVPPGPIPPPATLACKDGVDIGLRIVQGGVARAVAVEPGLATSYLSVYKSAKIHGIILAAPGAAGASKMFIETPLGKKALCLL